VIQEWIETAKELGYPFLRGYFQCQMDGWMLKRQFWLGLPADTDPAFMFKIIEDEMFSGNPPVLMIERAESRPDWNVYYHITLSSRTGTSWGPGHSEKAALKTIETVITTSAKMYEESIVMENHMKLLEAWDGHIGSRIG
jgi:hypothetical protein